MKFVWLTGVALAMLMVSVQSSVATVDEFTAAMPVVITSPSLKISDISRSNLRAMFAMRMHKWPDGTMVKVFVYRDDDPLHEKFSKQILNVFPYQLRQAWDRQVYSGLGQYPEEVASSEEMLSRIANTPGAIGYVKMNEVNKNVRVLEIR